MFDKLVNFVKKNTSKEEGNGSDNNSNNAVVEKISKLASLKFKIFFFGGLGVFLLLFLLIVATLMAIDVIDIGEDDDNYNLLSYDSVNNFSYWWPVGSMETKSINGVLYASDTPPELSISSYTGNRVINGQAGTHKGIDISAGGRIGYYNVIASFDGVVYYAYNGCEDNGSYGNSCGGGFGNHVVILHNNNVYTIYGHMASNSVKVKTGDTVKQGQVIGKIGNSGSSTGAHLHFQIDIGGYNNSMAINPLTYVDPDNPRPKTSDNKLLSMIKKFEGTGTIKDGNYLVYDDGYGNLTVGIGILISAHKDMFTTRGIDPDKLTVGSSVPVSTADAIAIEIINSYKTSVINEARSHGIDLFDYQIDALTSFRYNVGNNNCFFQHYSEYGLSEKMHTDCFSKYSMANGTYLSALARRREAEWKLLIDGIYPS